MANVATRIAFLQVPSLLDKVKYQSPIFPFLCFLCISESYLHGNDRSTFL